MKSENILPLSAVELDNQSLVKVDLWLDIDSEECRDKDPDIALTKKWMRMGFEDKFLFTDILGRVWGKGNEGRYYPYHFNIGKKLYGIRIAKKALS